MAQAAEIIISQRKDAEQFKFICEQLTFLLRKLLGERGLIKYHQLIPAVSSFAYLSCTNLFGFQTLGEEYIGLVQVDADGKLPSIWSRLAYLFIETVQSSLDWDNSLTKLGHLLSRNAALNPHISTLMIFRSIDLSELVKSLFLIFDSKNYNIGKSLSGITYLCVRPQQDVFSSLRLFIGLSALIQFATIFAFNAISQSSQKEEDTFIKKPSYDCKICSFGKRPICLPCGHICCTNCLADFVEPAPKEKYVK